MAEFRNPYTPLRAALEAQQAALVNEPIPPMFSPEEVEQRKTKIGKDRMYGELGLLSRDPALAGISKPLLEEAIKASQKKQTDHGEYDPVSGDFRYFPGYQRQRQEERLDKRIGDTSTREATAEASWNEQRQRAAEREELRRLIGSMKQPSDPGGLTYAGTDPQTGQPILLHSKKGLFAVNPDGTATPYSGAIGQKDHGITAGERKELTGTLDSIKGVDEATALLDQVPDTWRNKATTGILPGAISAAGRGGTAAVQAVRSDEFNKAYQQVSELSDNIRAGRFGMTLTPAEAASSAQYLPSPYDDVKALKDKLAGLKRILTNKYELMRQSHQRPGFPNPAQPTPGAPAAPPRAPAAAPKPARRFEIVPEG